MGDSEADSYIGGEYINSISGTVSRELASGTYYVVAYLDKDGDENLSDGDYYEIYDNKSMAGAPTPLDLTGGPQTITMSFGDANQYTGPVTYHLTVNVSYTGSHYDSGEDIWVDLWTNAADVGDYEAGSWYTYGWIRAASGSIDLAVDPGVYYMLAYLDDDHDDYPSENDPYEIYNNISKTGTPVPIDLGTGSQSVTVSFGDSLQW